MSLTREQIEACRHMGLHGDLSDTLTDSLCDMARGSLDRCTDAPEVGGAEPVAWKVGVRAFVSESDALNWCEAIQEATSGEQNPVAVPLYAHPPEVGLPDVNWRAVVSLMRAVGKQVLAEPLMAAQLLSEADTLERWLESAGQKESGE